MSDQRPIQHHLLTGGAVLMILFAIVAWSSNPDKESFRRFAARESSRNAEGVVEEVAERLLAKVALEVIDWEYINYGFFSFVHFPASNEWYAGAFGKWQRVEEKEN